MDTFEMRFSGALLKRGFWLYVWRIEHDAGVVFYVGRTGDSSSPNASSPFSRIGQHLDPRANAKGNALGTRLREAGIDPEACSFDMVAIGPLYPEQPDMERHKPVRDRVAALEGALADHLRDASLNVLGTHPKRGAVGEEFSAVRAAVDDWLPGAT